MICDGAQDGIEGAYSESIVQGDANTLLGRNFCLKNGVATYLMYLRVIPVLAQDLDELTAA